MTTAFTGIIGKKVPITPQKTELGVANYLPAQTILDNGTYLYSRQVLDASNSPIYQRIECYSALQTISPGSGSAVQNIIKTITKKCFLQFYHLEVSSYGITPSAKSRGRLLIDNGAGQTIFAVTGYSNTSGASSDHDGGVQGILLYPGDVIYTDATYNFAGGEVYVFASVTVLPFA